jgi:hypothetical protein
MPITVKRNIANTSPITISDTCTSGEHVLHVNPI